MKPRFNEKNQHVVPHRKGWAVKSEGSSKIVEVYPTKQEAIDAALALARSSNGKAIVHGTMGQAFREPEAKSRIPEDRIRQAVRSQMKKSHQTNASRRTDD